MQGSTARGCVKSAGIVKLRGLAACGGFGRLERAHLKSVQFLASGSLERRRACIESAGLKGFRAQGLERGCQVYKSNGRGGRLHARPRKLEPFEPFALLIFSAMGLDEAEGERFTLKETMATYAQSRFPDHSGNPE